MAAAAVAVCPLAACAGNKPPARDRVVPAHSTAPTPPTPASPSPQTRPPRHKPHVAPPVAYVAGRTVALTFDDGPDPTFTPQVLRLLNAAHVHATFCLIGYEAARHPDLVRTIVRDGNALCDHTWDHDLDLAKRNPAWIRNDITRGYQAILNAARVAPLYFRAPGGNWSPTLERDARQQGMTPLAWSVDPRDWSRPGTQQILNTIHAELAPGAIILMHDGGGDRSQTVRALATLLRELPRLGYRVVMPPTDR